MNGPRWMKSGLSEHLVITTVALSCGGYPAVQFLGELRYHGSCTAVTAIWIQLLDERMCKGQIKNKMTHSYRVFTDKHYAYFVTWTVVNWLPLFAESEYRQIVLDALNYLRTNKRTQLNAFVIMSTHVHSILWPDDGVNLSDVTRDFKRFTSRRISGEAKRQSAKEFILAFKKARKENRAQDVSTYQVWQEGSHPEAIFTEEFARQKLDYIHLNPVRAGLAKTADEWPYSSARAYLLGQETYPPTFVGDKLGAGTYLLSRQLHCRAGATQQCNCWENYQQGATVDE